MHRYELSDTLLALTGSLESSGPTGLVLTEAIVEIPLEVTGVVEDNRLVFFASPPHTRFVSGVLPPLHRTTLRLELLDEQGGES